MILFNDIIQGLALPECTGLAEQPCLLKSLEGRGVCRVLIDGDHTRGGCMACLQCLPEKPLGCVGIAGSAEHEVQRGPSGIHGAVEVVPLLVDFDGCFIHPVGQNGRL